MEKKNSEEDERSITSLWMLPEGCIAEILGLTSPSDVCRLSLVSKFVRSAAESDSVWEKFLPSDYQSIIAGSLSPIPDFPSKKDLFVYLCTHPLLIDAGRKSFSLEKKTGKKCCFLGARDLNIVWSDTPQYWEWTSLPESRFPEVAKLNLVWWLEIRGRIGAGLLSPQTSYTAYFVHKLRHGFGFDNRPLEASVGISGVESENRLVFLDQNAGWEQDVPWTSEEEDDEYDDEEEEAAPQLEEEGEATLQLEEEEEEATPQLEEAAQQLEAAEAPQLEPEQLQNASSLMQSDIQLPKLGDDGWSKVELGEFFCGNEDDYVEISLTEVKSRAQKRGLIIEGIEIRPKLG